VAAGISLLLLLQARPRLVSPRRQGWTNHPLLLLPSTRQLLHLPHLPHLPQLPLLLLLLVTRRATARATAAALRLSKAAAAAVVGVAALAVAVVVLVLVLVRQAPSAVLRSTPAAPTSSQLRAATAVQSLALC
jgi:hypothetical protein